jgi:hypothetical protein
VVREHLRELDGGDDPDENEVQTVRDLLEGSPSAPTGDQAHSMAMQVATEMVAPRLESMRWCVYDFGRPILSNDQNLWIPGGRTFPDDDL